MIIPDGILHHLSFDVLTSVPTTDFSMLSKNCLLTKYAISYHYSMLALDSSLSKGADMKGNFVAFTPVFSNKEKQRYLSAAQADSLHLDRSYLSLLPLFFTDRLARKVQKRFGGKLFSHDVATSDNFRSQAAFHRIIYIGTHAEANNDFPEYSRLIFIKEDEADVENSIYLYDISLVSTKKN